MSETSLWISVLLAAVISLVAIYFAVSPLLQAGRATPLVEDDKLVELLGRKDATLQAIKDLEFDYRVGKISQEDYQRLDQRLRRQAISLLQQIERIAPESASLDEQLESLIAQFRQTTPMSKASPGVAVPLASVPIASAPAPVAGASPVAPVETRFCTQCGKAVAATHKFCAHCGTPIAQADPAIS